MDSQMVAVYCLCDDLLKAIYHHEDRQCQMSNAEIMTTASVAMLYFRGNLETSRRYRGEEWRGYQPSKRRFFYGLKLHLMVPEAGQPVESFLTPGSYSDTSAMKWYHFDL